MDVEIYREVREWMRRYIERYVNGCGDTIDRGTCVDRWKPAYKIDEQRRDIHRHREI